MKVQMKDIEQYLSGVKDATINNRYRIARNAKRQDNIDVFMNYIVD